jgi:hypothetical protein
MARDETFISFSHFRLLSKILFIYSAPKACVRESERESARKCVWVFASTFASTHAHTHAHAPISVKIRAHYCFLALFLLSLSHLLNCAISYSNGYTPLIQPPMMNGGLYVWVRVLVYKESERLPGTQKLRGEVPKPFSLRNPLSLHFKFKKKEDYSISLRTVRATPVSLVLYLRQQSEERERAFCKTWKSIGNLLTHCLCREC